MHARRGLIPKLGVGLFLNFLWQTPAILRAQTDDLRFDHLSVEQGLSNFSITAIAQDHHGFLWIGTEDGLNKYDGYEFTVYKPEPGNEQSLPNSFVTSLCVDRHGSLWIGMEDGVRRYDPDTDGFVLPTVAGDSTTNLSDKYVTAIVEDHLGTLWNATGEGLYQYDQEKRALVHFRHDPRDSISIASDGVYSVFEDRAGGLWIGTAVGVDRYDRRSNSFTQLRCDGPHLSHLSDHKTLCIAEDRHGTVWFGMASGLHRFDRRANAIVPYHPDPQHASRDLVFDIYDDSRGQLWIGTFHHGLWRYDAATGGFSRFQHDVQKPRSLSQDRVTAIFEDRSGLLWIGVYRGGLNRFERRHAEFRHYKLDYDVSAILEDRKGDLWLGTEYAGLFRQSRADRQRGRWVRYGHDPADSQSLSNDQVKVICEDRQGHIWIGTAEGLNRYSGADDFIRYYHELRNDQFVTNKVIYEDQEGTLWVGTLERGLSRLDREKGRFTYYPLNEQTGEHYEVRSIISGGENDLWVGTFGAGLHRFDKTSNTFVRYQHNDEAPYAGRMNAIYSVHADASGFVWAGTFGAGLNCYDRRTGHFNYYTERDGLANNYVKAILPDAAGNLWLSTDRGLSRFNPQKGRFTNYTVDDGLLSNVFLAGAAFRSPDGRLFIGGEKGCISFHPDSIQDNLQPPPVVITRFKVFERTMPLPKALVSLDRIRLSYRQSFFSFEFAALDFAAPARNKYAYKLEGFDPKWVQAGDRRYASYTNVDPGEYIFRVKAANHDGIWNEEGVALRIIITPPFWKTWWFTVLLWGSIVLLAGGSVWYTKVRKLRERIRALERVQALERERLRISQDMHDEVGASLSEIAILTELAQRGLAKPHPAQNHLNKISERAREVIDNIGEIIWALNPKYDLLDDLAAYLRHYAGRYLSMAGLSYRCDFPEKLPSFHLTAEARRSLFLVFKEALHNIVKHAAATEVVLRLTGTPLELELVICDNGRGFAVDQPQFFGNGLESMKKRITDLQGTFRIQSQSPGGTQICVVLPVSIPHLKY